MKRFGCEWRRVVNEVSSQSNDPKLWFKILDSQTLMVRHHINFPWLMFEYKQDLGQFERLNIRVKGLDWLLDKTPVWKSNIVTSKKGG